MKYWLEKWQEKFWLNLAFMLPKRLAFWAFIRVHSLSGEAPGEEYKRAHDLAVKKWGLA